MRLWVTVYEKDLIISCNIKGESIKKFPSFYGAALYAQIMNRASAM